MPGYGPADVSHPPPQLVFRRRHRISSDGDYSRILQTGVRKSRGPITLVALPTAHEESRLGLSIGRRVGGAVVRTALKRRLRESFRAIRPDFARPLDIVITARRHHAMKTEAYAELMRAGWEAVERELAKRESGGGR